MDKEAVYSVMIGSLGAVIALLVCIIVYCAMRINRMKGKPKKVLTTEKLLIREMQFR